jgi:diazepam-binding inhibitor (GABA receptor modulator, acyl-CoA-binding protein)
MNNLSTEEKFNNACNDIKKIKSLEKEDMSYLYSYYKQATIGDCNIEKPFFLNFKEVEKYNAWMERKGINKDLAMKLYIKKVNKILSQK